MISKPRAGQTALGAPGEEYLPTEFLGLEGVYKWPEELAKRQILIQEAWAGA